MKLDELNHMYTADLYNFENEISIVGITTIFNYTLIDDLQVPDFVKHYIESISDQIPKHYADIYSYFGSMVLDSDAVHRYHKNINGKKTKIRIIKWIGLLYYK